MKKRKYKLKVNGHLIMQSDEEANMLRSKTVALNTLVCSKVVYSYTIKEEHNPNNELVFKIVEIETKGIIE